MSSVVRWEPFDLVFDRRPGGRRSSRAGFTGTGLDIGMDVYATENELVAQVEVPGIDPDDIDITVTADVLTIRGEIKAEHEADGRDYLWRERRAGSFARTISLPSGLNTEDIRAEFHNGLLLITIPKAAEAKARVVKIKAK